MIVEDKKVKVLNVDEDSGTCDLSAGETIHALLIKLYYKRNLY